MDIQAAIVQQWVKDETEHIRPLFNQIPQNSDSAVARSVLLATSTHAAKDDTCFTTASADN